jgi:hypothetical protein
VFGEVAKFSEWTQGQPLLTHTVFIRRRLTLNYDRKACQNILSRLAYEISDRIGQIVAILVLQKLAKTALERPPVENSGFVSNPLQAVLSLIRNLEDIGSRYSPWLRIFGQSLTWLFDSKI